ncbi:MAG: hypothetical protein ACI865_000030 [Flavobacteriaceae bacterium]|jgi:hypothetical protein
MRKSLVIGICIVLTSLNVIAQDEEIIDELADIDIYYDTTDGFTMNLGTDLIRIALGAPNISVAFELNERFVLDGQFGFMPLPYRAKFFGFETEVQGGSEFNIGLGGYLVRDRFLGQGSLYLGVEFERWSYNSSSFDVINGYNILNSIDANSVFSDNAYILALDYDFNFDRTLNRYGFELGVNYKIAKNVRLNLGLHLAYQQEGVTFDAQTSYGVTWEQKNGGFGENGEMVKRNTIAGLLSATLKYHLF